MSAKPWLSLAPCLLFLSANSALTIAADGDTTATRPASKTRVALVDGKWHIKGAITNPGAPAEGLLLNVRMVNSTFEDTKRPDFDTAANAEAFIKQIPAYVASGIQAFTLCAQGGMPGYEGAVNSAFAPDGSLRDAYMHRLHSVIDAADRAGAVVILGCYYQRQSGILRDEDTVKAGIVNMARWIKDHGYQHVVLEVGNEVGHSGYKHDILKTGKGVASLIRLARETHPKLLVSASRQSHRGDLAEAYEASDFILIHFNQLPLNKFEDYITALRKYGKPIVCNEDSKIGEEGAKAAEACVKLGVSWGFMTSKVNQYLEPGAKQFRFEGPKDDEPVYTKLRHLATKK